MPVPLLPVSEAAAFAARASYGRLLAYLCSRSRDIQACEDALADAFKAALSRWPETGVPDNPDAWLLTAARNRLIDAARHAKVFRDSVQGWLAPETEADPQRTGWALPGFGDDRLKLMFICAHPSIDESVRTPLMLQTILGLEAKDIASAFITSPAAMAKKLGRAKRDIKALRPGFSDPEAGELSERVDFVLEAIFAAYGKAWDNLSPGSEAAESLDAEAVYLADLAVALLPENAEALGLLALLLHCEARKPARRSPVGAYVPLDEQDVARWDWKRLEKAETLLAKAGSLGKVGRFQLEAALQSAHSVRVARKLDNRKDIAILYEALATRYPTLGARVGRAAAMAEYLGPQAGVDILDSLPEPPKNSYQPYWALRASLMRKLGRREAAMEAYQSAIGLSEDEAVRAFLQGRIRSL